jgi:hypothetical protein
MTEGPIQVNSCEECQWMHTKYGWDGDVNWCHHPQVHDFVDPSKPGWIGLDTITPGWCPFLKEEA